MKRKLQKSAKKPNTDKYRRAYLLRVSENAEQQRYIEAFLIMSSLIEEMLREILWYKIDDLRSSLKQYNIEYDVADIGNDRETLGKLIDYFERFKIDKKIINELKEFNNKRTECIHKMLRTSPEKLNSDLKKSFEKHASIISGLFDELIGDLKKLLDKLEKAEKDLDQAEK